MRIKGGDKWKKKLEELSAIKAGVKVGILDGATYDNGQSVAYIAYINEFGRGNNPPRPFMKRTREENADKWVNGIKANIKGKIFDRQAVLNAYRMCGLVARGDMQRTIKKWPKDDPPNQKSTIAKKRRRGRSDENKNLEAIDPDAVLIDSTTMIKAIGYEVTE